LLQSGLFDSLKNVNPNDKLTAAEEEVGAKVKPGNLVNMAPAEIEHTKSRLYKLIFNDNNANSGNSGKHNGN
jgi:hypothetical protein